MFKKFIGTMIISGCVASTIASGLPLHPEFASKGDASLESGPYTLFEDVYNKDINYLAPRKGRLVHTNGIMPAISFATFSWGEQRYGLLNAIFTFDIETETFLAVKKDLLEKNSEAKLYPMNYAKTRADVAVAGFDGRACFILDEPGNNSEDDDPERVCINMVAGRYISEDGPRFREDLSVSLLLSPPGASLMPNLVRGGAGLVIKLDTDFKAALPGFRATVKADYRKLFNSFASFSGYHDGICTDEAISRFFDKEVQCQKLTGENADEKPCTIDITYTDTQNNIRNNLFDVLPSWNDSEETKAWYNLHNERIRTLRASVQDLKTTFKKRFLEPIIGRMADVSREPSYGYVFRSDKVEREITGNYEFTLDTLQSVGTVSSELIAYTTCLELDPSTGVVSRSYTGDCDDYYKGKIPVEDTIPRVPQLDDETNNPPRIDIDEPELPWTTPDGGAFESDE